MSPEIVFAAITLGSFAASFVNAAFATGGIYIILLTSLSVLPVSAAIPLQAVLSAGSLIGRITYFWRNIQWVIVGTFLAGSLVGVFAGARTFIALPEGLIQLLLGIILIALIWLPKVPAKIPLRHPFFFVGIVHSFLGTVFGVGSILQSIVIRTGLTRLEITGTLAACMLGLDVLKGTSYVGLGFSYVDYLPLIISAILAGFAGTWAGKRVSHHISETAFRRVFRWLITVVALRLIYKGLS